MEDCPDMVWLSYNPEITGDYKLICNEICAEHEKEILCLQNEQIIGTPKQ